MCCTHRFQLEIQRALCLFQGTAFDRMCIDHRCSYIAVAQQRLNRPNVIARLQQMAGKTVAECMRGGAFNDLGFSYRRLERLTHMRFMQMIFP